MKATFFICGKEYFVVLSIFINLIAYICDLCMLFLLNLIFHYANIKYCFNKTIKVNEYRTYETN